MTSVTRVIKTAALMVPMIAMVGCASLGRSSTFGLDARNAALVRQTCTDIMGLHISVEFEACGSSLAETVQSVEKAKLIARADEYCAAQGNRAGTAELAKCVVMFRSEAGQLAKQKSLPVATASADSQLASVSLRPDALPAKYYYSMSQAEQQQRMELSCAQIGLHPSGGKFENCVTNLKFAIADTDIRAAKLP